jgi:uncharacterized protein YqgC (DUF456 family)
MTDSTASVLILLVLLVGLAGTLLPVLPGILLMWAGVISYGFFVGFDAIGIVVIVLATALTIAAIALGVILPKRAAADSGASWKSQVAAAIGAVIGFFVIPVVGIIVGAIVGIAIAEYWSTQDWELTKQSTIAIAKGFGLSTLAQFAIGFMILVMWVTWAGTVLL